MLEAYRVGISLVLESNIARAVEGAAEQFKTLDRIIKNTQASVNELAASMRVIGRVGATAAREWRGAAAAMDRAAASATRAAAAMRGTGAAGFEAGVVAGPRARRAEPGAVPAGLLSYYGPNDGAVVPRQSNAIAPYISPGRGFTMGPGSEPGTGFGTLAPYVGAPGGGSRGPGDGSGGPPSGGPRRLAGPEGPADGDARFMAGERYALDLSRPRHRGERGGLGAAAELAIPAYVGGEFLKSVFGAGFAKDAIESGLLQQGFTPKQVQQAEAAAIKTQQSGAIGSTEIGNLALVSKIMASVQDPNAAIKLLPGFAKMGAILDAQGHGEEGAGLWAAIRAAEFTGVLGEYDKATGRYVVSQKQLGDFIHKMTVAAVVSHGSIGPDQWLGFLRAGGISASILRDDDLFGDQMAIIQSLGPARAGRGLQAFGMQFSAGKMNQADVHLLTDMGIITDPTKVLKAGMGQYILTPGAMPLGMLQFMRDHPAPFILDYMLPHEQGYLRRHYGKHYTNAPEKQRVEMEAALTQQITSRIPGGVYAVEVVRNHPLIERDREAYHRGLDRDAYSIMLDTNPQVRVKALTAAWQSFEIALSDAAMKPAIGMLNDVTAGLNDLAVWSKKYPEGAKIALEGMAVGVTALGAAATGVFAAGVIGKIAGAVGKLGIASGRAVGGISSLAEMVAKLAGGGWAGPAAAAAIVMKPTTLGDSAMKSVTGKSFHDRFPNLVTGYDPGVPHVTLPPAHHDPVPVHVVNQVDSRVVNPKDIATGVTGHIVSKSRQPNAGYTGLDLRADPWSAGLQAGVP